jgi:nicotinamide-nucleotide amidase
VAEGAVSPKAVDALARQAAAALEDADATVATAESLTGGLLGAALTAVAGVSRSYRGGVIAYATDAKTALLGVPEEMLRDDGAVASSTAAAMAKGVRQRLSAGYGIATTGVAGPDPAEGKPAGTVYVAVAGPSGARTALHQLGGDRDQVRRSACAVALALLLETLAGANDPSPGWSGE